MEADQLHQGIVYWRRDTEMKNGVTEKRFEDWRWMKLDEGLV
jgi:hypothetical protein